MNLLKTMRNTHWLKYLLWVVVISFAAAIFFIWGGGGDDSGGTFLGTEYAVYVDGKTQSPGILQMRYRQQQDQYRQMLGAQFNPSFLRGACARMANGMADELILEEMARDYGLSVGDGEVADTIQRIYRFEDPKVEYPEMLARMGLSALDYEDMVRRSILLGKLRSLLEDSVYLSEKELLDQYAAQNERYKASVAAVRNADFRAKAAPPSEADLKAAYVRDRATLTVPEKRTVKYVLLDEAATRKKLSVDEGQMRAYYDSHAGQFALNADQRQASHILFKVAQDAPAPQVEAAKKKAQEVYDRAKKGEEFAELAKKHSEDPTAPRGGDLGWFGRGSMVKPFADAVFDQCQAVGDVVGPVQSQFGFHVIKLTGLGGQQRSYEQVRDLVKQTMLREDPGMAAQAKALFDKAADQLAKAKDDGAVQEFAKAWDLQVIPVTEPFTDKTPIMNLGMDPKLMKAIFGAKKDEWGAPMEFRGGRVRICVTSVTPAHPASFEEAKAELTTKILDERSSALAEEAARSLAAATGLDDLKKRAQAAGITVTESASLRVEDAIPVVGQDRSVAKALLGSEVGAVAGPLKAKTGWVVAVVTERTPVDPAKFAQEKDRFYQQQRSQEATRLVDDFVSARRRELEAKNLIRLNEDLIKRLEPEARDERGA